MEDFMYSILLQKLYSCPVYITRMPFIQHYTISCIFAVFIPLFFFVVFHHFSFASFFFFPSFLHFLLLLSSSSSLFFFFLLSTLCYLMKLYVVKPCLTVHCLINHPTPCLFQRDRRPGPHLRCAVFLS